LSCLLFWWGTNTKHRNEERKQEILQHWIFRKRLHRFWLHWYLVTQDEIELHDKTEIATQFYKRKVESLLVARWKQYIVDTKRQKKCIKKIKTMCKHSLKKRAFSEWYCSFSERRDQRNSNNLAIQYSRHRQLGHWQLYAKRRKRGRFNKYKARLFHLRSYFAAWLRVYEPLEIGGQYEKQLLLSIAPYINARQQRVSYTWFRAWYMVMSMQQNKRETLRKKARKFRKQQNKKVRHHVFETWRRLRENRQMIYFWNKSIIFGIIDDMFDAEFCGGVEDSNHDDMDSRGIAEEEKETELDDLRKSGILSESDVNEKLDRMEARLGKLVYEKAEFKLQCQRFLCLKQQDHYDGKLEAQISEYLQSKQRRKNDISRILCEIHALYRHFQQQC